jgi:dGTPase
MDPEIYEATMELRSFLFGNVYTNSEAKAEEGKAERLTEALYHHFCEHPEEMPADYVMIANAEGVERAVCDFIASMTDRYAISVYKKIFVPETWSKNNG